MEAIIRGADSELILEIENGRMGDERTLGVDTMEKLRRFRSNSGNYIGGESENQRRTDPILEYARDDRCCNIRTQNLWA